jgi:hypothetical protein
VHGPPTRITYVLHTLLLGHCRPAGLRLVADPRPFADSLEVKIQRSHRTSELRGYPHSHTISYLGGSLLVGCNPPGLVAGIFLVELAQSLYPS